MQKTTESWLSYIPDEWQPNRIKDAAQLSPGFSNGAPDPTELCTVVPMEAVSEKGYIDTSTTEEYDLITNGLTNFEVGDVLFAKITPCMENGKGAYVENCQRNTLLAVPNTMSFAQDLRLKVNFFITTHTIQFTEIMQRQI